MDALAFRILAFPNSGRGDTRRSPGASARAMLSVLPLAAGHVRLFAVADSLLQGLERGGGECGQRASAVIAKVREQARLAKLLFAGVFLQQSVLHEATCRGSGSVCPALDGVMLEVV